MTLKIENCKGCWYNQCALFPYKHLVPDCPCMYCLVKSMCNTKCNERIEVYVDLCKKRKELGIIHGQ